MVTEEPQLSIKLKKAQQFRELRAKSKYWWWIIPALSADRSDKSLLFKQGLILQQEMRVTPPLAPWIVKG